MLLRCIGDVVAGRVVADLDLEGVACDWVGERITTEHED